MTRPLIFDPPVIAHRGASAYAPENTLSAFVKAAQLGIKWVEFDVMQSADGQLIIFHDDELDRTTNSKGNIIDHAYPLLANLDAGRWFHPTFSGERIPPFLQIIEFLHEAKLSANIEIKALPGQEHQVVKKVLSEMKPFIKSTRSTWLFSSFAAEALFAIREHSKEYLLGLLLHEWLPDWLRLATELQCSSIHVNQEILTPESAKQIKALNKTLLSYTVNNPMRAKQLFSWGVDAVFSDCPDKILPVSNS